MFTSGFLSILCFGIFVPGLDQAQTRQVNEQSIRELISKLNEARNTAQCCGRRQALRT